jgi:hypothetical protein
VNGFTDEFKVTTYTTFKAYDKAFDNSVEYYANEYMNCQKRYEYAMIVLCQMMVPLSHDLQ